MKLTQEQLRQLVREELQKIVRERTVPRDHYTDAADREGRRRMSKSQISDRDRIGKAMKAKPGVVKSLKKKYGQDWESYLWAIAGNKTLGGARGLEPTVKSHFEPEGELIRETIIRLRDISSVVTLPAVNNPIQEALPISNIDTTSDTSMDNTNEDPEEEVAKAKLLRIYKQASALYNMLGDVDDVEEWVASKIGDAAECLNSAYNHIEYQKKKPEALGNGEGTPADTAGV